MGTMEKYPTGTRISASDKVWAENENLNMDKSLCPIVVK